jgi:lipopolysaccharide transport system ATP-binding protein
MTHVDVLLIDEILSVGDAHFRGKAQTAMQNRVTGEQTVVFVSHMADQVKQMCNRVIWLDKGKIAAQGDSAEVVDAYTQYVTQAREAGAKQQA